MAVTKAKKEQVLEDLKKQFAGAKSVVFTQYQGTNVKNMRDLRRKLRAEKVNFKVAKKTLMLLAAKSAGFSEIPESLMDGPIGLAFATGDAVAPAKVVHEFGKTAETVKISGAIFEGKIMDAASAKQIAMLPSREVLLARLVGSLKSPISGFHGVLHGLLRNFVYVVNEVAKKRENATPASAVPAEAPSA